MQESRWRGKYDTTPDRWDLLGSIGTPPVGDRNSGALGQRCETNGDLQHWADPGVRDETEVESNGFESPSRLTGRGSLCSSLAALGRSSAYVVTGSRRDPVGSRECYERHEASLDMTRELRSLEPLRSRECGRSKALPCSRSLMIRETLRVSRHCGKSQISRLQQKRSAFLPHYKSLLNDSEPWSVEREGAFEPFTSTRCPVSNL